MEEIVKVLDVKLVLVCSLVSWGAVQAVKPVLKPIVSPVLSASILRVLSILIGGASGYAFGSGMESVGVGCACGAVSTFTVALIKRVISKKADIDLEELEGEGAQVNSSEDS